jgi:AbrB family looped-hinge helix DNA binding protein
MALTTIKVTTAGRGQIPSDVRKSLQIGKGDTLIVEIKEILRGGSSE